MKEKELELFNAEENTVTTKELAESLGVTSRTVQQVVEKLGGNFAKSISLSSTGGRPSMVFTEAQATAIKIELQNHSKIAKNGFDTLSIANDLEAWQLQKRLDAYKDRRIAELQAENERQKHQLDEQKPMVEGYARIADSTGLKTVKEVADILGYGEKAYFAMLMGLGIFFYENGVNLPKRDYINSGYFEIKEQPYERNGKKYLYSRIYVTSKGLLWLEKNTPKREGCA